MGRMTFVPPSAFGTPALRTEDPRFLRGEARYLDDVPIPGALCAVFVRSMFPHAALLQVGGLEEARAMPGVIAVFAAEDLAIPPQPPAGNVEAPGGELALPFHRDALARDRLRFAGEAFAVVIAETAARGEDAAEVVWADAEPLEAVIDPEAALREGSPLLWPEFGTNIAHAFEHGWDRDVMAGSEVVVRGRFVNQRLAPVPMETNAIAVVPEAGGTYAVWASTQVPFDVRSDLAELLGVERPAVRVIAPDVGGGFGAKLTVYPEFQVVAKVAQILGRPVRWSETRSGSMVAMTHGRAQVQHVELGARRDGTLVGMRVDLIGDMGAYPIGAYLPTTTAEMLAGVYRWDAIAYRGRSVVTNTTPVSAYRGAGRPEAAALVERALDLLAGELGMDPVALRRKNLVPPHAFPFTTAVGTVYDSGDYAAPLDEALRLADYEALRAEQRERRARADHLQLGIGVATYVEITAFPSKEFASIEVEDTGGVTVAVGTSSHGQGHETAFAQLVGAILAVPADRVRVVHSDTALVTRGEGTWGSRSLQAGGSTIVARAGELLDRARDAAARLLEVDAADVEGPVDGGFRIAGVPGRAVTWAELASAAREDGGLVAQGVSRDPGSTFPFGAHVAVVEVDVQTGDARSLRHVAVDDCGRVLNPVLVRGQQHGGIAQGVAQALYEEVRYDGAGNPITTTLTGYAMPGPLDLPRFECANTQTPTTVNPLGVKGIGESGSIGSTPAVQNAVVDALAHLGVRHVDLPCTPERVWRAIEAACRPPHGSAEPV
jgi:carbon-monoxide dehydrogenase large subunit